jgi:trans-aconitate methyltransferase
VTVHASVSGRYFDSMYAASTDPWGFESRWYERRKHALTVAMLPAERYRTAFEPGCSIGVLTTMLAARCDTLISCDRAAAAVQRATERTRHLPNVRIEHRSIPDDWPAGYFDLIVLSELLYYFDDHDLSAVLARAAAALCDGGTLLAVHWRHPVPEHSRSGDDIHTALARAPGLVRFARHAECDFLADVYLRGEGAVTSVAAATGLL